MKLLVLTSRFPFPLEKGDKLRLFHQLKELANYCEITLCALSDHAIPDEDFLTVSRLCVRVEVFRRTKFMVWKNLAKAFFGTMPLQVAWFFDEKLKRRFHAVVEEVQPDHIYCQLIRTAPYAVGLPQKKTLDFMDNYSRWTTKLAEHQALPPAKWLLRREARQVAKFEHAMFAEFDFHTVISEQDREAFQFAERKKIHCIGNGVDTDFFRPDPAAEKKYDVAFVGNLGYVNNVEAAKFIAQKVAPLVKKELPGCRFLIAGARPVPEVERLAADKNVTIQGWMDDIREAYASSRIFIAPIFLAVGQQNKILEAMAMGLPCVTTPQVNNAIGADAPNTILLADSAASFASHLISLLKDDECQQQMSVEGLTFVRKNFSWETTVRRLRDLWEG